jgi:hypothetical protein
VQTEENTRKQFIQSEAAGSPPLNDPTSSRNKRQSDLGLFKLNSLYNLNIRNRIDYTAFGSVGRIEQHQDFYSSVIRDIDERNLENPYKIAQALNYYYTLDEKNIFALESQDLFQSEDPFYNAVLARSDLF